MKLMDPCLDKLSFPYTLRSIPSLSLQENPVLYHLKLSRVEG